jgi:hypothetical protein
MGIRSFCAMSEDTRHNYGQRIMEHRVGVSVIMNICSSILRIVPDYSRVARYSTYPSASGSTCALNVQRIEV